MRLLLVGQRGDGGTHCCRRERDDISRELVQLQIYYCENDSNKVAHLCMHMYNNNSLLNPLGYTPTLMIN